VQRREETIAPHTGGTRVELFWGDSGKSRGKTFDGGEKHSFLSGGSNLSLCLVEGGNAGTGRSEREPRLLYPQKGANGE